MTRINILLITFLGEHYVRTIINANVDIDGV
jgi:hypothetical protein